MTFTNYIYHDRTPQPNNHHWYIWVFLFAFCIYTLFSLGCQRTPIASWHIDKTDSLWKVTGVEVEFHIDGEVLNFHFGKNEKFKTKRHFVSVNSYDDKIRIVVTRKDKVKRTYIVDMKTKKVSKL